MSSRSSRRNNVLAGGFVIVSILAAMAVVFILADAGDALVPKKSYVIRFAMSDGAAGIKSGSAITLGGQPIGKVASVGINTDLNTIDVHARILADKAILGNARVYLVQPLLGSISTINFTSLGDPSAPGGTPLAEGDQIPARLAPPAFLAQAGYGPEQANELQTILSRGSALAERTEGFFKEVREQDWPMIRRSLENIAKVASDLREHQWPEWSDRIGSILEKTDRAAGRFDSIADKADSGLDEARGAIRSVQEIIDANREQMTSIVSHVQSATERFDTQTMDAVTDLIAGLKDGTDQYVQFGQRANTFAQEELPSIRTSLANARLASDQLKLTMTEVRRNPWRLLYRPKRKELESELLYDAARSYATAVSDLRAASEALQAALAGSAPGVAPPDLAGLSERLSRSVDGYAQAEKRLLDILFAAPD